MVIKVKATIANHPLPSGGKRWRSPAASAVSDRRSKAMNAAATVIASTRSLGRRPSVCPPEDAVASFGM